MECSVPLLETGYSLKSVLVVPPFLNQGEGIKMYKDFKCSSSIAFL